VNDAAQKEIFSEHQGFNQDLDILAHQATGEKISVGRIEDILQGRGFATLCMILSMPFVQPIPLPGLSVILGAAIAILGLRLTTGRPGGLPQYFKRREINTVSLKKVVHGARKIFSYVERLFKPRLTFMFQPPLLNFIGVSIVTSGIALSLPLPPVVLFSNSLPAWGIILLCLGFMERDGLAILLGHALAVGTWIYFSFCWDVVIYAIQQINIHYFLK
jgi:hypothetical protein